MSKLQELANACYIGASNPHGIINSLPEAIKEIVPGKAAQSVELKIIIGQLSFLLGESLGPTEQTLDEYRAKVLTVADSKETKRKLTYGTPNRPDWIRS